MYVKKIVERELYLTMTDTPGIIFFLAELCLWTVSFHKEGENVCMDDGSGSSPHSVPGHAQTDAQADASHLCQGKHWAS